MTPPSDSDADFTLTVTSTSSDGGDSAQTVDTFDVTVAGVADAPSLSVSDATGNADTAIAVSVTTALADTDGSESLSITVSGVPTGASLSAGIDNGDGTWTLTPAQLSGLTVTPPAGSTTDFALSVSATSTEASGGDTAVTADTINADGTFTYTANTGFTGSDSFTFSATDPGGATDTATVSVDVLAKTFDFSSTSEFQVNTYATDDQNNSAGVALSDGGFVITWESNNQDGNGYGIFGQRYDASGNAAGGEFQINTTTSDQQNGPSVTALNDGGFVVTWESNNQDGNNYGVFGQRYDASGTVQGSEFQVNTTTNSVQTNSSVTALNDGGFVVTWESNNQDGDKHGIFGQRYDASGNAVGGEFQVNTTTSGEQLNSRVAALNDGGFVVTWESENQDGDGNGVYGQQFDASGDKVGGETLINDSTAGEQDGAEVMVLGDGSVVVSWTSSDGGKGDSDSVFADYIELESTGQHTMTGGAGNDSFIGGSWRWGRQPRRRGGPGYRVLCGLGPVGNRRPQCRHCQRRRRPGRYPDQHRKPDRLKLFRHADG